ncbi:EF-hand [Neoconidiobolus thromboides FSU 785]|nr:EF-hand [Neoconidiobolus thromboides FSU 785]
MTSRDPAKIGLNNEQIEQARELFAMFDKDNDGKIVASEIEAILKQLGQNPSSSDVNSILEESDIDRNGNIDFEEFLKVTAHKFIPGMENEEDKNKKAFEQFDQDKDGYITKEELKKALMIIDPTHTEQDIENILKSADINTDGKITYEEFCGLQQ